MELDLSSIRERLDRAAERMMLRLKDRTYFPQNLKVYEKGAIPIKDSPNLSFCEFSLRELERYHAKLGRFKYKDQVPLIYEPSQEESLVERETPEEPIGDIKIDIWPDLSSYYVGLVKEICEEGDDPTTYGETVYCDADVLYLMGDRIQVGRYVAESKYRSNPNISSLVEDPEALKESLRRRDREVEVITHGGNLAEKYGLPREVGEKLFRWIIEETIYLEVEYLRQRISSAS